jgi:hypothetical protein
LFRAYIAIHKMADARVPSLKETSDPNQRFYTQFNMGGERFY